MAESREELYDSLADDAKKLCELGKSWGLSDADIGQCFQRALSSDERPVRPRQVRVCRCLCTTVCCVAVLLVVFFVLMNVHKPSKMFVMRHSQGMLYPLMRAIRISSMPLRKIFDVSSLHELDCIIPNPFFGGLEQIECWPCESVRDVRVFRNFTNFTMYYYHSGIPVLVKDANLSQVTFDDLRTLYLDNAELLSYSARKVQSSNPYMHSIGELFTPTRTVEEFLVTDMHVQWRVLKPGGVRLIRSVSPKPYFVPRKAEVATEMYVLIHTPAAGAHALPYPEHPNVWLTQGYGSQEITLTPVSTCKDNCTEVSIVLEASDVLYYAPRFWQLSAFAFGDQVSIAFMGSFY